MAAPTEIQSLNDLADISQDWESRLADPGLGLPMFWYRGHADEGWELAPTVLRTWFGTKVQSTNYQLPGYHNLENREMTINRDFRRMAASFHPGADNNIDTYFIEQHHGMPTRLLDWTRNAIIGLFFAICSDDNKDGAVYVMDPRRILPVSTTTGMPSHVSDVVNMRHPIVAETTDYLFGEGTRPANPFVVPVLPDLRLGRMLQQDSCFTLHMPDSPPLQPVSYDLEKYIVPKQFKSDLRYILRTMGIGWANVYYDLDNVAKDIRTAWQLYP